MIIYRNSIEITTINPSSSSKEDSGIMAAHQFTLSWVQSVYTIFEIGDYIIVDGQTFKLKELPTVKKISSTKFQYDGVFKSSASDVAEAAYLMIDNTNTPPVNEFPLTGNALTFVRLLVANLNRVAGYEYWFVGDVIDSRYTTLQFSNESCMDVLGRLATEFDTEWMVSGNTIHLNKVTRTNALALEYGSTLYELERLTTNNSNIITRLYAYGAERNIASSYRDGAKRLMLPGVQFIEANTDIYGVIEASKTFDDIYPRLNAGATGEPGTVTSLSNIFRFIDSNLDFNINTQLLDGTKPKVHFLDGQLGGYDFEISSYNNTTKAITLVANTDETDLVLPNATMFPQVGDKYVLLDIKMPQAYIDRAEQELQAAASEYLDKNKLPQVTYRCKFSDIYSITNNPDIRLGDIITVRDAQLGVNEAIRIVKISRDVVDRYKIDIDLANSVTPSTLERITQEVNSTATETITQRRDIRQSYNRSYRWLSELQSSIFDADGYFDMQHIKPLSIETSMLSTGSKSQQFQLTCTFQPNADGDAAKFRWSAGSLFHFTISDTGITTWNIPSGVVMGMGATDYPAYIYARCSKTTNLAEIIVSTTQYKLESVDGYYMFLLGVLHSPVDGVCGISLTYGQTTINGQFIRTGVISSIDGAIYFDLNNGQIVAGPNKLNADGSISFGNGNFTISTAGDCTVKGIIQALSGKIGNFDIIGGNLSGYDDNGVKKIDLTLNDIIPLADLISSAPEQTNYLYAINTTLYFSSNVSGNLSVNIIGANGKLVLASGMTVTLKFPVIATSLTNIASTNIVYQYIITNGSYTKTVTGTSGSTQTFVADTAGTMDVQFVAIGTAHKTNDSQGAKIIFSSTTNGYISTTIEIGRTSIGKNGVFSFWNSSLYFYFSKVLGGLKLRGTLDAPCVPCAVFTINGSNATTAVKNARISISATNQVLGEYVITHNIGHSLYTVNATPMSNSGENVVVQVDSYGFSSTGFRLICRDLVTNTLVRPLAIHVIVTEIV